MEAKLIKINGEYILNPSIVGTKLSLKNCEAVANGYDLDDIADTYAIQMNLEGHNITKEQDQYFKDGFMYALELLGNKKFSEEDMRKAVYEGVKIGRGTPFIVPATDDYLKSLQKNEWDVVICCEMDCHGDWDKCKNTSFECELCTNTGIPKLDENGCLILRRK